MEIKLINGRGKNKTEIIKPFRVLGIYTKFFNKWWINKTGQFE